MSLFGSIGNIFSGAVSAATSIVKKVTSPSVAIPAALAVVTKNPTFAASSVSNLLGGGSSNPLLPTPQSSIPGGSMAGLDLSTLLSGSNATSALRSVTSAITPSLGGLVNLGTSLASVASNLRAPTPQTAVAQAAMGGSAATALTRVGAAVGRSFFQKFPNLANALQQLRNRGMNVKRSQLYSLLRRFGPELLITGGLLTAGAVSELMIAGPGRRRMNPANGKALRRSIRRLESFEKLCHRVDRSLHCRRGGRRKSAVGSRGTTLIRQG